MVLQSAQVAVGARLNPSYDNIVLSGRAIANFDWIASQVSGSAHTGDSGLPHPFDGQGHPLYCEIPAQLRDQAREGPERSDRGTGRQAATSQQVEKLCHRGGGEMESIHGRLQEGRPDPRGADSSRERSVGCHQGTACTNADAVGHGWNLLHRNLRRGGDQNGCSLCNDFRWAATNDGIPEQPQTDGRSNGGRAAEGCQETSIGWDNTRRAVFYGARQGEALGSACQP